VWFCWEGTISLATAETLIDLFKPSPAVKAAICKKYPNQRVIMRLPLPAKYNPPTKFSSNKLTILEPEDIASLIDGEVSDVDWKPDSAVPHHANKCSSSKPTMGCSPKSTPPVLSQTIPQVLSVTKKGDRPPTLQERVDEQLCTPPVNEQVYQRLIMENFLANTIGVYGETEGLKRLEQWIQSGSPDRVDERIGELHKYHNNNVDKGYVAYVGPLCFPEDLQKCSSGIFGDLLDFIGRDRIRQDTEKILFAMVTCVLRAEMHKVEPWFVSTRQLDGLWMGLGRMTILSFGSWRITLDSPPEDMPSTVSMSTWFL